MRTGLKCFIHKLKTMNTFSINSVLNRDEFMCLEFEIINSSQWHDSKY